MVSAMDRHALSKEGLPTIAILIVITTAALIVVVFVVLTCLRVVRPLSQLSTYIDRIRLTPPGADAETLRCEEITRLCSSFNTMLREQARLTRELQQCTVNLYSSGGWAANGRSWNTCAAEKINPHFLYTIRWRRSRESHWNAWCSQNCGCCGGALGKLFRHNIQGSDMIPLGKELEITQAYLTIQKLFHGSLIN